MIGEAFIIAFLSSCFLESQAQCTGCTTIKVTTTTFYTDAESQKVTSKQEAMSSPATNYSTYTKGSASETPPTTAEESTSSPPITVETNASVPNSASSSTLLMINSTSSFETTADSTKEKGVNFITFVAVLATLSFITFVAITYAVIIGRRNKKLRIALNDSILTYRNNIDNRIDNLDFPASSKGADIQSDEETYWAINEDDRKADLVYDTADNGISTDVKLAYKKSNCEDEIEENIYSEAEHVEVDLDGENVDEDKI